ncbi:MAG: hypothetical protein HRU20_03860 [Pseudomonadales bacterium]|nr:hypothetical protein [Pseudomonadales bacterium]
MLIHYQKPAPAYVNLGKQAEPQLLFTLNMMTISGRQRSAKITATTAWQDGYQAMQSHLLLPTAIKPFKQKGFICTQAAITTVKKLERKVKRWKKSGFSCATLIIGDGSETMAEAIEIANIITATARKYEFPLMLELHRASVTEGIPTVLMMIKANPDLRFNADFSHYILSYRLDQIVNDALLQTLLLMQPIFARVAYFHGRYATSENIQTPKPNARAKAVYFLLLDQVFQYFKREASAGDVLFFAPELLQKLTGYAYIKRSPQGHSEYSDRYHQSLDLNTEVKKCFDQGLCSIDLPAIQRTPYDSNRPTLEINREEDFYKLDNSTLALNQAQYIVIRLGNYLNDSANKQQILLSAFIHRQQQDPRLLLDTRRNTQTHDLMMTQALLNTHADIRLHLNASEWILSEEITIAQLRPFRRRLKTLAPNIVQTSSAYATAEHQYDKPLSYTLKALLSVSVIMEIIYSRFYQRMIKK